MALNTTLGELVTMLREEAGMSANASTGRNVESTLIRILNRNYRRLHMAFDWPHLKIRRSKTLAQNERYYAFPSDMDFNRVSKVEVLMSGTYRWRDVEYGIDWPQYNYMNSDLGVTAFWPRRWQIYENSQFEIWPVPDHTGDTLRFEGVSNPVNLVNQADQMDLDDDTVVLYAAGELLAKQKSPDAQMKLQQAADMYRQLRARSQKADMIAHDPALDREPAWQGTRIVVPRQVP